jgi:hypothetical protein
VPVVEVQKTGGIRLRRLDQEPLVVCAHIQTRQLLSAVDESN